DDPPAGRDQCMLSGRNNHHPSRPQPGAVLGLDDRQSGAASEQLRQPARALRLLMYENDDGRIETGGESGQDLRDGAQATGGSDEADHRPVISPPRNGASAHTSKLVPPLDWA